MLMRVQRYVEHNLDVDQSKHVGCNPKFVALLFFIVFLHLIHILR